VSAYLLLYTTGVVELYVHPVFLISGINNLILIFKNIEGDSLKWDSRTEIAHWFSSKVIIFLA